MPISRKIRDQSIDELVIFLKSKIDGASTNILAGDFNILRYELPPYFLAKLFGANPDFVNYLPHIEEEYAHLVEVLSDSGHFEVINCWERDNPTDEKCVTFGESNKEYDYEKEKYFQKP